MSQADPRLPVNPVAARRVKLQHLLFLMLLLTGIVPLLLSSFYLLGANRDALKVKEKELLTLSAQGFAQLLSDGLEQKALQLEQIGRGLIAAPGFGDLGQRLSQDWAGSYLQRFAREQAHDMKAFMVIPPTGKGFTSRQSGDEAVIELMQQTFQEARASGEVDYRFVDWAEMPAAVITVPIPVPGQDETLVIQAFVPLVLRSAAAAQAGLNIEELLLIDAGGKRLWSASLKPDIEQALLESELVNQFAAQPVNVTRELSLRVGGKDEPTLAQVVPVHATGWGVVAHRTSRVAFQQVRLLVVRILLFSALAVLLALVLALFAARGFSLPIQRLAEATHEIAAGHFDRRVSTEGLSFEVAELAADFNRMSDTVQSYIARLQRAAEVNRQLFISSIRAFAAAIDAKDPYTRGHSERVASYSRAIARYLGLPKDMQEKVWISAVLHDIGKIGVEDQVLKKHGVLTPEEFDQMKLHPVIGADIVEPISALRDHLPGIRWHHEAWNGSGYPDGLKGEQIPLMARIIGVADTFDAITTNRPYQTASSPEFALQTIKKLTGKRFDAKIVTAFLLAWDAGQIKMDLSKPQSGGSSSTIPRPDVLRAPEMRSAKTQTAGPQESRASTAPRPAAIESTSAVRSASLPRPPASRLSAPRPSAPWPSPAGQTRPTPSAESESPRADVLRLPKL